MSQFLFKYYPKNRKGRDFVVGDIHGMFNCLESLLDRVSFNPEADRVFSVGDLIDRGHQSDRVLEFLDQPWFSSIMGNHESMLLDAKMSENNLRNWVQYNGGSWWEALSIETQDIIHQKISQLPYLFEIETEIGNVGVAHADVPCSTPWPDIVKEISSDEELMHYVLWSRVRHKNMRVMESTHPVDGVELVVMGHTPHRVPLHHENIFYIDTGATYQSDQNLAALTMLQIHPVLEVHQHSTYTEEA